MTLVIVAAVISTGCQGSNPASPNDAENHKVSVDVDSNPRTRLVSEGWIVDLTHPFDEQTIYWPTENLANLDKLPPEGALAIALPMKIAAGSGGPLRVVAIVP
jgi:hypothetical protein